MSNLVAVPADIGPAQVEHFPKGCERSRKGALHLKPSSTIIMTDGELAHARKKLGPKGQKLRVVTKLPVPPAEPEPKAAAPAPAVADVPAAIHSQPSDTAGDDKPRRGRGSR